MTEPRRQPGKKEKGSGLAFCYVEKVTGLLSGGVPPCLTKACRAGYAGLLKPGVRASGISLYPDRLSGLLAATLFVLASSSGCLLAGVVGTCGWGAI